MQVDFRRGSRERGEAARRSARFAALAVLAVGLAVIILERFAPVVIELPLDRRPPVGPAEADPISIEVSLPQMGTFDDEAGAGRALQVPSRLPGLSDELLSAIEDDMPFRPAEADAWFQVFHGLSALPPGDTMARAGADISYRALQRQPREYRGRLVTFRGTARRALAMEAPPNTLGIDTYFQLWVFPETEPIVVYCWKLPPGFPLGDAIREEVRIAGVFFKRLAYGAVEGPRTAPAVAALEPFWLRPSNRVGSAAPDWAWPLAVTVGIVIALLVSTLIGRSVKRSTSSRRHPAPSRFDCDFASSGGADSGE